MRMLVICVFLTVIFLDGIICPPVTPGKKTEEAAKEKQTEEEEQDQKFGLEYEHYLKEVVSVLESDDQFRKKLEESNVTEIKSGEIARHLEFVNHGIRTKLDELKRKEIDRLRQAMKMQAQLERGFKQMGRDLNLPQIDKDRVLAHVDHRNPNTFEVDDLAKLIKQATSDLEELDKKRREEFKEYEMEKERERQEELKNLDEEKRKAKEAEYEEMKRKHADHPKVHHPGNKEQLEEVWEESDGMNKDDWDPKTFFYLHDTNGDGSLDEHEVEALFQNELDKVYGENPEDDPVERDEEMNRMREHVFGEVDKDGNKVITLEEFLISTQSEEFEKDEEWDTLEDQKIYTDEELEQYVKQYEEQQRREYEAAGHKPPQDPSQPPIHFDPNQDHLQGQAQDQGGAQRMDHGAAPPAHQGEPPAVPVEQQQQQQQEEQQEVFDHAMPVIDQQQQQQQIVDQQNLEQQKDLNQDGTLNEEQQQENIDPQQQQQQQQQQQDQPEIQQEQEKNEIPQVNEQPVVEQNVADNQ